MLYKPSSYVGQKRHSKVRWASRRPGFGVTLHVRTTQKSFVDGSIPEPRIHTRITVRRGRTIPRPQLRVRAGYFRLISASMGGWAAGVDPRPLPSPAWVDLHRTPHSRLFCGPSHLWEGQGRRLGTFKREMVHEGVMQARVSERVSWVPGCDPPRGTVHDEGPRRLGTSQGALSWSEVNTTVPVLLTENKNDRQESAGPPTCTATKRIWGKRAWGPDGRPCWPCTVL